MPKTIRCPSCNHHFFDEIETDQVRVYCEQCGAVCSLPEAIISESANVRFCTQCGEVNDYYAIQCHKCDAVLVSVKESSPSVADEQMEGKVIHRNTDALLSFYTGIIALLPFIGLPLVFYAVWKGYRGLNYAKGDPDREGRTYSIVGMVGGLAGIALWGSCLGKMLFSSMVGK